MSLSFGLATDAQDVPFTRLVLDIADKTMTTNSSDGAHVPDYASYLMREEKRNNRWNLKDLGTKWTIDAASAAMAAGLVAPIVTAVDKYASV